MKLSSAWIVVEDGQRPAVRVAVRTLRKRLDAVWREFPAAGADHPRDADSVHRLRVATRRALAAIEAFGELLPARQAEWFTKRLRKIRRSAGEARDLDVLTDRLAGATDAPSGGRGRRRLVAMLSKQREESRKPIRAQHERLLDADWLGRVERLLAGVSSGRRQPTFREYARRRFRPLMQRFFSVAKAKLRDTEDIHALRIEGKRLRYAMEIFAAVFPTRVRNRCYDALEQLQKTLGEFTDHATAADRFRRLAHERASASNREILQRLRLEEEARADEARKAFVHWWDASRRRALRRRFQQTLRKESA
ncbi:MAG: CHAD domain-containing protein [Planctomycetia bacterium]|nr:CHAD domain-containing protein [Planctomycetia bacterium]